MTDTKTNELEPVYTIGYNELNENNPYTF